MNSFAMIPKIVAAVFLMFLNHSCAAHPRISTFVDCKDKKGNVTNALSDVKLRSNIECARLCTNTHDCRSISYRRYEKTCRMYTKTMADKNDCDELADESGTIFSFLLPQCVHGGSWNSSKQKCESCDRGFAGQYCERHLIDCEEAMELGYEGKGEILIQPLEYPHPFRATCNFDLGHTVVLRRGILYKCGNSFENFNRTWDEYKEGFGSLDCEHFLGLEALYFLTQQRLSKFRVSVHDGDSWSRATYNDARIATAENGFTMTYGSYKGNSLRPTGDGFGLGQPDASVRNAPFCTPNKDCGSCAKVSNSGWWFGKNCSIVNLHVPLGGDSTIVWPMSPTNDSLVEIESVEFIVLKWK